MFDDDDNSEEEEIKELEILSYLQDQYPDSIGVLFIVVDDLAGHTTISHNMEQANVISGLRELANKLEKDMLESN